MIRSRTYSAILVVSATWISAPSATAYDPPDLFLNHLDNFVWTGAGDGVTWQTPNNWTPPNATYLGQFPNDPGRIDDDSVQANIVQINNVEGADLSGPLSANRTVNIASGNVTIASLKLGGTGSTAVTTNITATGTHRLIFENAELNDTVTNPGDPEADPEIEPEPIWSFNQGASLIWSVGTAGAGRENRISADVQPNDRVDIEGDRDLHFYGTIYEGVVDRNGTTAPEEAVESSINSMLTGGATVFIHGDVQTVRESPVGEPTGIEFDRGFGLNVRDGVVLPTDPQNPPQNEDEKTRQAKFDVLGRFIGTGAIYLGNGEGNELPLGTIILRADNRNIIGVGSPDPENPEEIIDDDPYDVVDPYFDGRLYINRGNFVLAHDGALGEGDVVTSNPVQAIGINFISDNDNRNIATDMQIAQWITVRGGTSVPGLESFGDHSIEFSSPVVQTNTRGWINLLPEGKTLTLSGPQYPLEGKDNHDQNRIYTVDGSGTTIISGGILNRDPDNDGHPDPDNGHFRVRGTGAIYVDWDGVQDIIPNPNYDPDDPNETDPPTIPNPEDRPSEYSGYTWMEGGNLHFGQNEDLGTGAILSRGGAVGVDAGVLGNTQFLTKLNNSSNPNFSAGGAGGPGTNPPFFLVFDTNNAVITRYSEGGLMLGTTEYNQNLDFTTGDLARAANMTLAAHEDGSSYTGTITPASTLAVNPNTYRLGGGTGTLTLPNPNQLTGARNLLVTNGGDVFLDDTNNYTGTTTIQRKYVPTLEEQAEANQRGGTVANNNGDAATPGLVRSTLTVSSLANGGAPSSIGTSSNAASNLIIQGSTLKYVGAATSTDRLLTVGTAGSQLDASGTGPLTFSNTAPLDIDVVEDRAGLIANIPDTSLNDIFSIPTANNTAFRAFQTDDLVPGIRITDGSADFTDDDSVLRITDIASREALSVGETDVSDDNDDAIDPPSPWPGYTGAPAGLRTFQLGAAPARTLTLSGSNTGNNTFAPLIGNAADVVAKPAPLPTVPPPTAAQIAEYEAQLDEYEDGYGTVGITKIDNGRWILTNNNTYSGPTNVRAGTLVVNGTQSGGGTTTVSNGATLGGNGALGGALINNGTVAPGPGAGAGTLTVNGTYIQNSGSTLAIEIGGTGAGAFDRLTVLAGTSTGDVITGDYNNNGTVDAADYLVWRNNLGEMIDLPNGDLDATPGRVTQADYNVWRENFGDTDLSLGVAGISGTINVDLINGFAPTPGNMFTILTAVNLSASSLTLTGESTGFSLVVNPTSLVLHYTGLGSGGAVPEPTTALLLATALAGWGLTRQRRPRA